MSADKIEKKDSKKKVTDIEQGHVVIDVAKKLLRTTWGMRIGLGIVGLLLFFIGYIIGNWGTSELRGEVTNKKGEINDLLAVNKRISDEKMKLNGLVTDLKIRLSDSKSKMRFLKQRVKIRKPLYDALEMWKTKNKTETEEKLYAALINLKSESSGSMGLSRWFYDTAIRRLTASIQHIKNGCPFPADSKLSVEEKEKACHSTILMTIAHATEILPAPKE
ncbi:hypothetical protein KKF84_11525 [Myxococcota bacterium]|nr:hypothetical protein [Myxococcota bacterium]MBU1535942.1 hypothetical protein [Myxococcota bacterium]